MGSAKTILVIGAGWEQYALIEAAKSRGYRLVATHPLMNTDGFSLADAYYVKDSTDIEAHYAIAVTHDVDAVITDNCDYSLYTAAVICHRLGLPGPPVQSAIYSIDKYAQREACRSKGLLQPAYRLVRTPEALCRASNEIGFPQILKPVDSRGTFGVTIIDEEAGLPDAYLDAVAHSPSRTLILERYIAGVLVTVDGFCFKNGHKSLTVASRRYQQGPKPVTKDILYPAAFSRAVQQQLRQVHQRIVEALAYQFGHTHGEYILTDSGDIYLVECANRGGGVYTSSTIVPLLTGIDVNQVLIDQALGRDTFEIDRQRDDFMQQSVKIGRAHV